MVFLGYSRRLAALEDEGDAKDGWVDDYSEDGSLPAAEPMSHGNIPDGIDHRRGNQAMPASVVPTASGTPAVYEIAALRHVLRRIGGVPEFVVACSEETILGYLTTRLGRIMRRFP